MKLFSLKEILGMKVKDRRSLLVSLNKEAKRRAKDLIKAGYDGEMTKPPTVDAYRTPTDQLARSIEELQIYNRDDRSTVEGMREFVRDTLTTLDLHGYDFVNEGNLAEFGRFMNSVREKHYAKSFPSNEVARLYSNMEELGISPAVMEKHFKEQLSSQEGIGDLLETLEEMNLPSHRKRISSTEVKDKMRELGLWED